MLLIYKQKKKEVSPFLFLKSIHIDDEYSNLIGVLSNKKDHKHHEIVRDYFSIQKKDLFLHEKFQYKIDVIMF